MANEVEYEVHTATSAAKVKIISSDESTEDLSFRALFMIKKLLEGDKVDISVDVN